MLPYHGDTRDFTQPMPNGMGPFTLITEQIAGLSVSGPGIGARRGARAERPEVLGHAGIEPIPPGGVLSFTLMGLPSTDSTGHNVAGGLALALMARRVRLRAEAARRQGRRPGKGAGVERRASG